MSTVKGEVLRISTRLALIVVYTAFTTRAPGPADLDIHLRQYNLNVAMSVLRSTTVQRDQTINLYLISAVLALLSASHLVKVD